MDQQMVVILPALIGIAVGLLVAWMFTRGRIQDSIERTKAEVSNELATCRERVRAVEDERQLVLNANSALKSEAESLRESMDMIRDERTKLAERASRIPALEAQVTQSQELHQEYQKEILRLSTSEAEKIQSLQSVSDRLAEVGVSLSEAEGRAEKYASLLGEANERRSALEVDVARITVLEQNLSVSTRDLAEFNNQMAQLREDKGRVDAELKSEREQLSAARAELKDEKTYKGQAEAQVARMKAELAELNTRLEAERQQAVEKLALLMEAKDALVNQFKTLANDILEEKSKRFTDQNQINIGQLLEPLKVKLQEFQGKVEEVYVQEGKDRTALAEQVRQLMELNQVLSQDAKNLTRALKGSSKTQGNWGELVLERVLESAGLRNGEEYDLQESHKREDGTRAQPDVILHLPEDRHLVVDAKVSLIAYEDFVVAEDEAHRQAAIKRHLESVRGHIKLLSEKNYQALYHLKSLDFVLMFIPIEPAFMLAVTHDRDLFMDAWKRNVLLVSPSTLLFVVRTVAHLWRQEAQNRNAQEIANRGAELYDKLVGFIEDLESLGNRLKQAQKEYEAAHSKLTGGRGNLIRQAEMLKQLGVKPSKTLPSALVESSFE